MKKLLVILCLVAFHALHAQEIINRKDTNQVISILTSSVPLQLEPLFCSVNAGALIPKDTVTDNMYVLSFSYDTPKDILLDTTAEIEIRFSDSTLFTFNNQRNDEEWTPKDSSITFQILVSYNCLKKMTKVPVSEIRFVTPLYTHRIEIEDKMKLFLPNLSKCLLTKASEEYASILSFERSVYASPIVFDPANNQQLDKKYLGKYSGEWHESNLLYTYDLYLQADTSYIVWHIINDPAEAKPYRIKTQTLNIRSFDESQGLVMDVCYEADKPDYTDGRRTFYVKLSQNEKVLYGETWIFGQPFGKMYGIKKKSYRR